MNVITPPDPGSYEDIIAYALSEDLTYGDITTDNINLPDEPIDAELIAKEDGVLAGFSVFTRVFMLIDEKVSTDDFNALFFDGDRFSAGDVIAQISLFPSTLLKGERVALNFLQHLSGIATFTNLLVEKAGLEGPKIVDTRKTIPGLRSLQKYAVRVGGGVNHRMSLSHAVLIKNNHISLADGITNAVNQIRQNTGHMTKMEVEVQTMDELNEALSLGVDIIMLDNFSPEEAKKAVDIVDGKAVVELSGGITEDNFQDYIMAGIDIISVGSLTHSVNAIDLAIHIIG